MGRTEKMVTPTTGSASAVMWNFSSAAVSSVLRNFRTGFPARPLPGGEQGVFHIGDI